MQSLLCCFRRRQDQLQTHQPQEKIADDEVCKLLKFKFYQWCSHKQSSSSSSGVRTRTVSLRSQTADPYGQSDASHCHRKDVDEISDNYWSSTLCSDLSVMMKEAGYDQSSHDQALAFCSQNAAPFLGLPVTGTKSRQWQSFMTDDFTPLEYSWTWGSRPKIRFSFEPVGATAGGSADPFNRQRPLECVEKLRSALPGADWTWFDSFADSFYDCKAGSGPTRAVSSSSPTTVFIALELGEKGDVMAKAYLVPVRAEQIGVTRLSVLGEAVRRVETATIAVPAYKQLEDYLHSFDESAPFDIIGVAVDCLAPELSKLKIYVRSPLTSFDAVCSTLTMGNQNTVWTPAALAELRELWYLVLGLDEEYDENAALPTCNHETGGVLYNFDVQANNAVPDAKLYIPVKHYGKNDGEVLKGLFKYLERRGQEGNVARFTRAVKSLCQYRDLCDGSGFQTYISCAVKKGKLSLTSYISPQLHHPGRW